MDSKTISSLRRSGDRAIFLNDCAEVGAEVNRHAGADPEHARAIEHCKRNAMGLAKYQLRRAALVYAHVHGCHSARALVIHGGVIHALA